MKVKASKFKSQSKLKSQQKLKSQSKLKSHSKSGPRRSSSKVADSESALTRIPKDVQIFLADLQSQIRAGTLDLTDWRLMGLGILNRLGDAAQRLKAINAASVGRSGVLSAKKSIGRLVDISKTAVGRSKGTATATSKPVRKKVRKRP